MKGKSAKRMLLLAAAVLVLLVFAGCDPLMNLIQGDIDVAGTWVDDWGTTWVITNTTFDNGWDEPGTIVSYSNADQYFIFKNTNPSSDLDQDRFLKVYWRNLDLTAAVKVEMGGVYDSTAVWGETSSYWATQEEAEEAAAGAEDVSTWSTFVDYTAP